MQGSATQFSAVQFSKVQLSEVQSSEVQFSELQCSVVFKVQCSTADSGWPQVVWSSCRLPVEMDLCYIALHRQNGSVSSVSDTQNSFTTSLPAYGRH